MGCLSCGGRSAAEPALPEAWLEWAGGLAIHRIKKGRPVLIREVKQNKLDAVLPAVHSLRADFPRPWVGYAYDFQHKYFPEHFPPENRRSRDEHFSDLLTAARAVIVNSRAVAADIARFVPEATARVFALPFAPAPQRAWGGDRPETLPRYGLAPPYFLISNQFWMHKDHATAFEAFRLIAAEASGGWPGLHGRHGRRTQSCVFSATDGEGEGLGLGAADSRAGPGAQTGSNRNHEKGQRGAAAHSL